MTHFRVFMRMGRVEFWRPVCATSSQAAEQFARQAFPFAKPYRVEYIPF